MMAEGAWRAARALVFLLGCGTLACAAPRPLPSSAQPAAVDGDGVGMLYPTAPGFAFHLGVSDPNRTPLFEIEKKTVAMPRREGALSFWNVAAHHLNYSSGGEGVTARLHVYSSPGPQQFTWRTQHGYLTSP